MSLPTYLSKIKSSGIYRFVWDKSEIPGAQAETLRLVVGYSEKGPFNTPVYVKDEEEFKTIYGGISKKLERYGVWFHRMAIQALRRGPILALNIKPFDTETVKGVAFDPQDCIVDVDPTTGDWQSAIDLAVKDIYNRNRFWSLDPEQFEDNAKTGSKYISIFATDSKESSNTIFVRGYQPTGYDVTVKEWYSSVLNGEDVPSYLEGHENDYISQYWAEIYIFKGEFTPTIATSDKLAKFFDVTSGKVTLKPYLLNAFGEKLDTLEQLSKNDASNFVKSYAGILLPEFLSSTNTVLSLDAQFNSDQNVHKMMMNLNKSLLYNGDIDVSALDTTGWTIAFQPTGSVMSLDMLDPQVSTASFDNNVNTWSFVVPTGATVDFYDYDITPSTTSDPYTIEVGVEMGQLGVRNGDKFLVRNASGADEIATIVKIDPVIDTLVNFFNQNNGGYTWQTEIELNEHNISITADVATYTGTSKVMNDLARIMRVLHELPEDHSELTFDGNVYQWDASLGLVGSNYVQHNPDGSIKYNGTTPLSLVHDATEKFQADVTSGKPIEGYELKVVFNDNCEYTTTFHETSTTFTPGLTDINASLLTAGYAYTFDKDLSGADFTIGSIMHFVKCVNSVTATSSHLRPQYLEGYTYANSKPKSTKQWDKLQWQHSILDTLGIKGINIALTDRVSVNYRYLVDTFEGFVESDCKSKLAQICKKKDNVLGLLNAPSMTSFAKCDYTSFTDENGLFDTKYIPMGGNPQKAMGQLFTLASEEDGASWVSYNTGLNMRDPNTGIKYVCPPAALVSNLYMDKYTKFFPYTIIAGPNRAVIRETGLIGPDFNFSREDLDNLEPFGLNCMVQVPGQGTYINSNQTAKQNPVTTLSKINVRELCIFLQDEIEKLLQQYQWDFNTPNLQATIKDRADVILETAKNNGGVYKYLNVCDSSNNTDEVINNEFFILSTSIEPGMGAGKMVQNLTLYRKGGMSSTIVTY